MHVSPISNIGLMSIKSRGIVRNEETTTENPINESSVSKNVSFGEYPMFGVLHKMNMNVTPEIAEKIGKSLSSSTSGHRGKYGSDIFNSDIVQLITVGVAKKANENNRGNGPWVIIGGDTRQASRESLPLIKDVLNRRNVNVYEIENPVPTPLLAYAAKFLNVDLGVLMTASHNPWEDGGYNLVTNAGAIAPGNVTKDVAKYMVETAKCAKHYDHLQPNAKVVTVDPYNMYRCFINDNGLINWRKIEKSGLTAYYDGLQGTGVYVLPKLLDDYHISYTNVVSGGQEGPNPTDANLSVLKSKLASDTSKGLKIGVANDGDADRFGIVDENGKFINPNDVILLTAYHLAKNKGRSGAVIRSQATSMQLDRFADIYGLRKFETPVGFKYIAEDIEALRKNGEDVLVAGEESGGLTVNGHIPEKDGILAVLLMMDLVATENKPISQILKEVKDSLGVHFNINNFSQKFERSEAGEAAKDAVMNKVSDFYNKVMEGEANLGNYKVDAIKTAEVRKNMETYREGGDGYKFILEDGSTVLLRKSGTEPLIKCYIESTGKNEQEAVDKSKELEVIMRDFMS
ncbi:MAG: hypothetical protein MJ237_04240 [bacterium]|nr:hypothetical protein [bacterium]